MTVNNVAPTVTLSAANDLSVDEGSQPHLQLHHERSGRRTTSPCSSTDCGANGTPGRPGHLQHDHRRRQLRLLVPRRPGLEHRLGPGRGLRRRRQQHRQPDGHRHQRRPDRHPDRRRPRPTRARTHTYSFTVSDPGADTFVLDATDCGTNGTQVGADTLQRRRPARAASTAPSPTARRARPSASPSATRTARPTATRSSSPSTTSPRRSP